MWQPTMKEVTHTPVAATRFSAFCCRFAFSFSLSRFFHKA
jgi:hypothetical protein